MATDFSPHYVKEAARRLRWTPLWFQIKLRRFIKKGRLLQLKWGSKKVYPSTAPPMITEHFDSGAGHFQRHKWVFVEHILSPAFHQEVVRNWPKKKYLEPPRQLAKSYDVGFRFVYGDTPKFTYSDPYGQYPTLQKFSDYVRSEDFAKRMTAFVGRGEDMVYYSFIVTDASAGAEVLPHRDSIAYDEKAKTFVNMVFFIDAAGGDHSGGLSLSRDNELKELIFEPPRLTNACLIYDSFADFYHGFPPIAKGKFRWSIGIQFCDKKYVQK